MGSFSSNGTKAFRKGKGGGEGGFFTAMRAEYEPFLWEQVDGDLLRQVLDALTYRGRGMAFYLATGGRGMKVILYSDQPPSTAMIMTASEMNAMLQWVLDQIAIEDAKHKELLEGAATWAKGRQPQQ